MTRAFRERVFVQLRPTTRILGDHRSGFGFRAKEPTRGIETLLSDAETLLFAMSGHPRVTFASDGQVWVARLHPADGARALALALAHVQPLAGFHFGWLRGGSSPTMWRAALGPTVELDISAFGLPTVERWCLLRSTGNDRVAFLEFSRGFGISWSTGS
jgi:hypothetical protein